MLANTLRATAIKLIDTYGFTGILSETNLSPYDPNTGEQGRTVTDHPVKYAKSSYSSHDVSQGLYGINDFQATLVFDSEIRESWLLDGAEIINVESVGAQDMSIIYKLQCRGQ